jgi:hypothetical protein
MAFRLLDRLSPRAQRRLYWVFFGILLPAVIAAAGLVAWSSGQTLLVQRTIGRMTGRAPCRFVSVSTVEESLGRTRAEVYCRYVVDGRTFDADFPLPTFDTGDVEEVRELATAAGTSGALVVHYDPADPVRATFVNRPQWVWPALGLAFALVAAAWAVRAAFKTFGRLRVLKVLEDALERVEAREAAETARALERQPTPRRELTSLSTRNHLPARPPPGWSVPMASKEGRGAWMIETPGVLVVAKLVRVDRGRVKLQVGLIPEDHRRLEDPEALALLRHFRAVDDFVEDTDRGDEIERDSPWVRVFLATPRAASPETWGEVKHPREMLN